MIKKRTTIFIATTISLLLLLASCSFLGIDFGGGKPDDTDTITASVEAFQNHEDVISTPMDDTLSYITINDDKPEFTEEDWNNGKYYIKLSELDSLGRVGVVQGLFDAEHMPEDDREEISSVTPTGWAGNNNKYSFVSANYIYNRCHLLGFQISGLNAEKRNLMTGTRFFNIDGNLAYENIIADHLTEMDGTNGEEKHQVLIRVTPDFYADNLVAHGEYYEADCLQCDDIDFSVYMFNKQPGVTIDYHTGRNWANDDDIAATDPSTLPGATDYVYSSIGDKFHVPSCRYADSISPEYRIEIKAPREWMTDTLKLNPCGVCKP